MPVVVVVTIITFAELADHQKEHDAQGEPDGDAHDVAERGLGLRDDRDAPASRWVEPPATAPAGLSSSASSSGDSDDDSSLEDSIGLPPLPDPGRVSSASTISALEVGL